MTSLNLTTAAAALKSIYQDENFKIATYERRPILGMLPKDEGFFGDYMPLVVQYGNPQGVSATFATAQATATASKISKFLLSRVNHHSVATLDGETLEAMSNDSGAFITGMKCQIDAALKSLADRLESLLPLSGTGSLGRISTTATISDKSVYLNDINDIVNFEVGMTFGTSATDGGAVSTGSATGEVLYAVNRRTGLITATSAAMNTVISGAAAGDYVHALGDAQAAGTKKVISGFSGWLPSTAPTVGGGDSYFGLDRSTDSRLYGNYHDGSSSLLEEALIDGQSVGAREGAAVDTALVNPYSYRRLIKELGSKVCYDTFAAKGSGGEEFAKVGFRGVQIHGDAGEIKVVAANKIPSNKCFAVEMKTWKLCSIGPATKFNMLDGNRVLRQTTSDGIEARLVFRGNLGCVAPWANVHILLPT